MANSRVRFADNIQDIAEFGKKRRIGKLETEHENDDAKLKLIKKHTLDSDEEDNDKDKYEKLDVRKVGIILIIFFLLFKSSF